MGAVVRVALSSPGSVSFGQGQNVGTSMNGGLDGENLKVYWRAVKLFIRVINPDNLIDFLFFEYFPDIQPTMEFVYFKYDLKGGSNC